MTAWIVTRQAGAAKRYRSSSGRLTADRAEARRFDNLGDAFDAGHEGDTIEPAVEPWECSPAIRSTTDQENP